MTISTAPLSSPLAGLTNALKVVGKKKEDVKVVTSGAGAAAISIVKLLPSAGYKNITMCDRKGAIYAGRDGLNWIKEEMAQVTNLKRRPARCPSSSRAPTCSSAFPLLAWSRRKWSRP